MWFHKHSWVIVSSVYTPPMNNSFKASNMSESAFWKLATGFTVMLQRCEGCGELKTTQALGKHVVAEDVT